MALSYVRSLLLRSTFAATAPRSAVAELGVVRPHGEYLMRFLDWNRRKVQNLTAWEIWLFIAGRVLMSFGLGALAMKYLPDIAGPISIPTLVIGIVLLLVAAKGFSRKQTPSANDDDAV